SSSAPAVPAVACRHRFVCSRSPAAAPAMHHVRVTAHPVPTVVLVGPSGAGKSTLLPLVAARLGAVVADGDTLHPPANVAKMAAGEPLTDTDRAPWLAAIATWIGEQEAAGRMAVVACSALKERYRDVLRAGHPGVVFVQLVASEAELE